MSSGLHYFWWKVQIILIVRIYMYTIFTISLSCFLKRFSPLSLNFTNLTILSLDMVFLVFNLKFLGFVKCLCCGLIIFFIKFIFSNSFSGKFSFQMLCLFKNVYLVFFNSFHFSVAQILGLTPFAALSLSEYPN